MRNKTEQQAPQDTGRKATLEDMKSIIDLLIPLKQEERTRLIKTAAVFFDIYISS